MKDWQEVHPSTVNPGNVIETESGGVAQLVYRKWNDGRRCWELVLDNGSRRYLQDDQAVSVFR